MTGEVTFPLDGIPDDGVVAAGSGDVLLGRVDGRVVAYENRCLHRDLPLDGGVLAAGVLTCPHHLWRYRLSDGACTVTPGSLRRLEHRVVGGVVHVEQPPPAPSLAEVLRAHARAGSDS